MPTKTASWIILAAASGCLCLSAGSAHLVYPGIPILAPVLGFVAGMILQFAIVMRPQNV